MMRDLLKIMHKVENLHRIACEEASSPMTVDRLRVHWEAKKDAYNIILRFVMAMVKKKLRSFSDRVTVWDNGGKTYDRYTVLIDNAVYTMSDTPESPLGFNQFSHEVKNRAVYVNIQTDTELGWKDVPADVQKAILNRIM